MRTDKYWDAQQFSELKVCGQKHSCRSCGKILICNYYPWDCPWVNDDEIAYCDECENKLQKIWQNGLTNKKG